MHKRKEAAERIADAREWRREGGFLSSYSMIDKARKPHKKGNSKLKTKTPLLQHEFDTIRKPKKK